MGSSDGARDRGLLFVVGEALSSEIGGAALRDLNDDWTLDITGRSGNECGAMERR